MRRTAGLALPWLASLGACASGPRESGAAADPTRGPGAPAAPCWIWTRAEAEDGERAWFRRSFELPREILLSLASAELRGSADNVCAVYLDGRLVAEGDGWEKPFQVEVAGALHAGTNVLAAWCRNDGGPAGLWLELALVARDGTTRTIRSDGSFKTSQRAEADAGDAPAHVLGPLGIAPWGAQTDFVAGTPGHALAADELELPPGFHAELVYSVPRAAQGSWVALAFDERGRMITSDQNGPLYRVTLRDGAAPEVEEIELPIGEAQGLCCAFGALYAVVSSDRFQSGLYRLRDTDGDDRYDELQCLKEFQGSGEHGPHGIVAGPVDAFGRSAGASALYVVIGNHTNLPAGIARTRMPRVWGEDQLLPREPDPNGHAVGRMAPGGVVLETDPDGRRWELVAGGLRNAYDLAFDDEGELFTFDSDMEWDVGLPWYRPTRVLHVVSGADFGWRNGSGKWPADVPDSLPSVLDLGRTSPTGMAHGSASRFPGTWQQALFVADWQNGAILAVGTVWEENALVERAVPFVRGRPLPVTALEFGPDGTLYFTTGGRDTQSGLYRVVADDPGAPGPFAPPSTLEIHRALAHRERRLLEAQHGNADPGTLELAWRELGGDDRERVHAARTILEGLPAELWQARALAEQRTNVALPALLALARSGARDQEPALLARVLELLELPAVDLLPRERAEQARAHEEREPFPGARALIEPGIRRDIERAELSLLRTLELAFVRMGKPEPELAARIDAQLESLFPNEDARLDRELVQLLVFLESPGVIEKALALIDQAQTQEDALAIGWPLRVLARGWTKETRLRYFRWMAEVVPTYRGGESFRGYMDAMLGDAQSTLTEEDLDALALVLPQSAWRPGFPSVDRPFVHAWTMSELLPALARLAERVPEPASPPPRDLEHGAELFGLTCLACHRIGDDGGSTGPDLTGAGGRFSPRDLLESILEPSRTVSDQYRDQEVWTTDERVWVGRIIDQDDARIVVRTTDHEVLEIPRAAIAELHPHPLSRMPEGLLDTFTEDEVLDLIAFVLAGGSPDDPAFAPDAH